MAKDTKKGTKKKGTKKRVRANGTTEVKIKSFGDSEWAKRWNLAALGVARFDKYSVTRGDVKVQAIKGQPVPQSRHGIAAYMGSKYGALLARERGYREKGMGELEEVEKEERGRRTDIAKINAELRALKKELKAAGKI